jgi:hypothetical protein
MGGAPCPYSTELPGSTTTSKRGSCPAAGPHTKDKHLWLIERSADFENRSALS